MKVDADTPAQKAESRGTLESSEQRSHPDFEPPWPVLLGGAAELF